jgi:hypothetical protein
MFVNHFIEMPHRRVRRRLQSLIINTVLQENEDVCAVCNGSGRFLCCERCPRSFHFSCLNPPLDDIPEGMWFCNLCTAQTNPPDKPPRGLFSDLIDAVNRRNPTSFRLPVEIRNYFLGVETGSFGEYVDTRDVRTQRYKYATDDVDSSSLANAFTTIVVKAASSRSMTRTN